MVKGLNERIPRIISGQVGFSNLLISNLLGEDEVASGAVMD